jgi:hypothetical protein
MNGALQPDPGYIRRVRSRIRVEAVIAAAVLAAGLGACGADEDYQNKPRPPSPINVTAAIDNDQVLVSPLTFGGGPVVILISNQSDAAQKVTLETDELGAGSGGIRRSTGTIEPRSTGQLKVDAPEGTYTLSASAGDVAPAVLEVSKRRRSAQDQLLLP